jgi:RNA polymerase primary sigma factor
MAKNGDDINLRRLINIGKDKGYITYKELNEDLSDDVISSEEIDDLLQMFEDLNIKVVNETVGGQIEKVKKIEEKDVFTGDGSYLIAEQRRGGRDSKEDRNRGESSTA